MLNAVTKRNVFQTSPSCRLCNHPKRNALDLDLVMKRKSQRAVAKKIGISNASVSRHVNRHLRPQLGYLLAIERHNASIDIMREIRELYAGLKQQYELLLARKESEQSLVPRFHAQLRKDLELLAKIMGELEEAKVKVEIHQTQQFVEVNQTVINALSDFPEARLAVAAALKVNVENG